MRYVDVEEVFDGCLVFEEMEKVLVRRRWVKSLQCCSEESQVLIDEGWVFDL